MKKTVNDLLSQKFEQSTNMFKEIQQEADRKKQETLRNVVQNAINTVNSSIAAHVTELRRIRAMEKATIAKIKSLQRVMEYAEHTGNMEPLLFTTGQKYWIEAQGLELTTTEVPESWQPEE